jgi:hypothetical protein
MGKVISGIFGGGGGGGGGAPPPSSQTVTNTSIPEYARPYVEKMLGKTEALTDIEQNPYQNYGGQRIADFNQMQKDAFERVAAQTPAGQIGTATQLSGLAGAQALGIQPRAEMLGQEALGYGATGAQYGGMGAAQALARAQQTARQAGMYGGMGAGYGARGVQAAEQGFGAGEAFARQATDPYATQAYMSPYMQNVVDVQKQEAMRDYAKQIPGLQAQASRAGAFGGSRQAILQAEAQRNLGTQLGQIQAAGSQKAFEDAQRQQQFGANLGLQGLQAGYGGLGLGMQGAGLGLQGVGAQQAAGQLGLAGTAQGIQGAQAGLSGIGQALNAGQYGLQGLGTGLQAAGTLGQLGQTQFGQEQAINQARQQVGAVQQAQAQQGLDLAYQDFLKQRNYPYQQLAFQSDMLRGLPLSQASQQIYTAPPSQLSQLGGLGMSALGIYGMSGGFRGATGGLPKDFKRYAKGGLAYSIGGDVKSMTTDELEKLLENPGLTPLEVDMVEKQLMIRRRMEMNPESDQIMAPALGGGVASIPTGNMVPMEQMAGGGIVAFSKGGDSGVDNLRTSAQARQSYRDQLESEVLDTIKRLKSEDPFKESRAQEADIRAQIAESKKMAPWEALAMAGLGTMSGTSQYGLSNLGLGATEGMKTYGRRTGEQADLRKLLLQQGVEREKSKFARETGLLGAQQTSLGQIYGREAMLEQAKAANRQSDATRENTLFNQASNSYLDKVAKEKETLRKRDPFNTEITEDELERQAVANVRARLPAKTQKILFGDEGSAPAVSTSGQTAAPATVPAAAPAKPKSLLGPYEKLPKVATQAEYDKLKPGAQYIDPDGNVRKKK